MRRYAILVSLMDLKQFIRDIPDFPQPGILFRDITPLLQDPKAFRFVMDRLTDEYRDAGLNAVVAIESRGFIFGAPLARNLGVSFVPVRKAGKLPAKHISVEYSLEYGTSQLDIHEDALQRSDKALIVDDLLATGGTANAAAKLVELLGAKVHAIAFVIELAFLHGRDRLRDYEVLSLVTYD
jgi:adenine phosphoribosyltransferase